MNPATARLRNLLGEAEALLPRYLEATADWRTRRKGFAAANCSFSTLRSPPKIRRGIFESGRARAQSTLVLARLFPGASIVSLESDPASPDVTVAAERLRECDNVDCLFGDSLLLLPKLVEAGDVVLIDGPKDFRALKLAFRLLRSGKPLAVFVHDLWLGSPARRFVDRYLPSALLSDDPGWVQRYASLDSRRRSPPPVSNAVRHAYGATMGCFEASQENYSLRLLQSSAAQGADRIRETARKILRRPSTVRPKDFATFPISTQHR